MGWGGWSHARGQWHTHIQDDEAKQGQGEEMRAGVGWDEKTMEKTRVRGSETATGASTTANQHSEVQDNNGGEKKMAHLGHVHVGTFLREVANQLHPAIIMLHFTDRIQQRGEAVALDMR